MKRNFIRACEKLGIAPEKTLVIGDSLWSDIFGGKRNNMKTALIQLTCLLKTKWLKLLVTIVLI